MIPKIVQPLGICMALRDNGLLAKPTHGNIIRFAPFGHFQRPVNDLYKHHRKHYKTIWKIIFITLQNEVSNKYRHFFVEYSSTLLSIGIPTIDHIHVSDTAFDEVCHIVESEHICETTKAAVVILQMKQLHTSKLGSDKFNCIMLLLLFWTQITSFFIWYTFKLYQTNSWFHTGLFYKS